jgi:hypothetical protein
MAKQQVAVKPDPDAAELNRINKKIHANVRLSLVDAQEAGRILLEVKERVGHGNFGKWIDTNLEFTQRTARTYMRVYENRALLDGTKELSIRNAYLLMPGDKERPAPKAEKPKRKRFRFEKEVQAGPAKRTEPQAEPEPDPESPEPPKPHLDPDMHEIPERLMPVFLIAASFESFQQVLSYLKSQVRAAAKDNPDAWCQFNVSNFESHVDAARSALKLSAPYIVCSYCRADTAVECRACGGKGFLSRAKAAAVPKEIRQCS